MKEPKTINEQIEILRLRGLQIQDLDFLRFFLEQVNYYRFSGYFKLFMNQDVFDSNITFDQLVDVYNFDCALRKLLLDFLGYIEILIKTQIALQLSLNVNLLCYKDVNNFSDKQKFDEMETNISKSVNEKYSKEEFIKHFQNEDIPIWVIVEIMSFGDISKMFANLTDLNKDYICNGYLSHNSFYLKNYLKVLSSLRNTCAHLGRIFDKEFCLAPRISKSDKKTLEQYGVKISNSNHKLFIYVFIMMKLIKDKRKRNELINEFKILFDKYKSIDISKIGFTNDWEIILSNIK